MRDFKPFSKAARKKSKQMMTQNNKKILVAFDFFDTIKKLKSYKLAFTASFNCIKNRSLVNSIDILKA